MAARKKTRAREAQLAFEALSIEGGLLSPDWLSRAAQLAAGGQAEADYRIPKGLNIRDEIGRFWRIAQAHWSDFATGRAGKADARLLAERFVAALLHDCFGFATISKVLPFVLDERSYPIGFAALGGSVPVVIVAPRPESAEAKTRSALDDPKPEFADASRRRSAFGLAQEYLNASVGAMWGLASDGLTLRIVRDNASLTRPAWIEADLQRMFTEERYADFAALWLLAHETRFGRANQPVTECALETWRNAGREEGTRAREHLRRGVEDALMALGQGFLEHSDNSALRAALQGGTLSTKNYFNQLLRLVYRLIFLLTVEERGVLHPDSADEAGKALYAAGYGLRRLRERSVKRSAHDRFADLWESTKIVFRGVAGGETRLGLPALAGIFASTQCPALDVAKLENRALLLAVFKLSWLRDDSGLARVNWRDMGPEELGSVYESLLELVPQIAKDGRQFAFATGGETKGNARKTTGSYYTPDSLVQALLDSALEPVIADTIAKNPGDTVQALLGLSIVDPACGSGHFLLAAARRLAAHVARLQANGTPSAAEYRHALRQVVGRCIFGVDLNSMAVELCKVSLWMEAVEPGLPLTFLNSHIQHGNALLGTTPELMAKGIPDAAWDAIEGDDKKIASALKKRNKQAADGQRSLDTLWPKPADTEAQTVTRAVAELDATGDANVEALAEKEERWDGILGSPEYRHQKFVADAWCGAFVWPKRPGELTDAAPTNELWRQLRDGHGRAPALTTKTVDELAGQYRFFHWHLQFPQVFAQGGFDVVLGNPPWERVKLSEQEYFAWRSEEIATAPNALERKRLIAALLGANPQLWTEWCIASRTAEGESHLARQSGRYPLCGRGDVNTYALFAEHNRTILGQSARAGFIAPTGLATDETTSDFFDDLMVTGTLASLFDFENRAAVFPGVHRGYKFALITFRSRGSSDAANGAEFAFFAYGVADLNDPSRRFVLTSADVKLVNPETRTCPIFRSRRDAELTQALYRNSTVLGGRNGASTWGVEYLLKMVDPTIHRDMLLGRVERQNAPTADDVLLYEGKSIYHFDHRYALFDENEESRAMTAEEKTRADFFVVPRYWLRSGDYQARVKGRPVHYRGFLSIRDITNVTNERTVVTAVRPFVPALNSLGSLFCRTATEALFLCGCLNSFAADYIARQKVGGTHLSPFYLLQLAVVAPDVATASASWQPGYPTEKWVRERVLELTYTAWDLEPFARDVGYDGPPFRWNPERRFHLRSELDAAFFHLYGLSRDDTDYVMETFPIVRKNDEKAHGEYRTKRVILEIYDAIAEAVRTGGPYRTRLDPPPADPRVAHPPRGGATVLPFRPSVRPLPAIQPAAVAPVTPRRELPAWSPELLPAVAKKTGLAASAARWGTTLTGLDLGVAALAAVLRNMGGPASRDDVERAVVLSVLPGLLRPKFDTQTATKWRRAVGTANMNVTSIAALSIPWAEVLRGAAVEHLLDIDADGRWRAGADIDDAPSDVLDARALVSLSWLENVSGAAIEDTELVTQLGVLRAA